MIFGRKLPHRFGPFLFAILTSGIMSLIVSGVATWKALGLIPGFGGRWLAAWTNAWPIAFSTLLVVAPFVRTLVSQLVASPPVVPGRRGSNGA
ncbi:MAG: DUF2798 domain-containing protein [Hyphomicrobiaceae bacterium]